MQGKFRENVRTHVRTFEYVCEKMKEDMCALHTYGMRTSRLCRLAHGLVSSTRITCGSGSIPYASEHLKVRSVAGASSHTAPH